MPFITGLFIFSFCFVFYIIWHQFLRKDARLSVSLKVLQKKMNMLETFSKKTDLQLIRGIELLEKKNKDLEKIVSEARFCIFKMEKLLIGFEEKNQNLESSSKKRIALVEDAPSKNAASKKKMKNPSKFDFGESPFSNLNFVETGITHKQPDKPLNP